MAMEMRVEDQRLMVVRVRGVLRRTEFDDCQRAASKVIGEVGHVATLILLEGFQGWERGDQWGDVSFLFEHDSDIEKMAIVGQRRWHDEVLMFVGAGLRHSAVRYFDDEASARAWLAGRPT